MNRNTVALVPFIFLLIACTQKAAEVTIHKSLTQRKDDFSYSKHASMISPVHINIEAGQTLYSIANEHDINLRELIDINRLRPPYKLAVGQTLRLPSPSYHTVKPKDTIYHIAKGYEVSMSELVRANRLHQPYNIQVGQKLKLPAQHSEPEESKTVASAPQPKKNYAASSPSPRAVKPVLKNRNTPPKRTYSKAASNKHIAYAPSGPKPKFSLPVKGKVISKFGPKKGGLYNDGLNIAVPMNSKVKAAEGGTVVYAGNELRGYGNLLLIKHNHGYLTAYAHNNKTLVKKGQIVKRGDIIAYSGKSGNVKRPQLHFSIRKGRKAINPSKLIRNAS